MPSFDIVSELNPHEVTNAVDQASREVGTRFDFKGTGAKFEQAELVITLSAPADFQLKQMMDILKLKLTKRGIDIVCMKVDEPVVTGQTTRRMLRLPGTWPRRYSACVRTSSTSTPGCLYLSLV
jgi:uncharacterized protein YajQ (UPF0234 family)